MIKTLATRFFIVLFYCSIMTVSLVLSPCSSCWQKVFFCACVAYCCSCPESLGCSFPVFARNPWEYWPLWFPLSCCPLFFFRHFFHGPCLWWSCCLSPRFFLWSRCFFPLSRFFPLYFRPCHSLPDGSSSCIPVPCRYSRAEGVSLSCDRGILQSS